MTAPARGSLAALRRRSAPTAAERQEAMLALLRSTGAQGGRIDPHRSIATIDLPRHHILLAAGLAAVTVLAYVRALPWVTRAWTATFEWLAGPLGIGGPVALRSAAVASVVELQVPYFAADAAPPGLVAWWVAFVVTVGVIVATLFMGKTRLPLAYALRFAAAIQTTALVFFAFAPDHFPHDLASYVSGMMLVSAVLIGIVPLVLGLTFYLIDVGWSRKVALTVLVMGHLAVLVPLQYALQAALIVHGSLVILPLCFILFGMLPEIIVLIAFFGWGMSWSAERARGRRQ